MTVLTVRRLDPLGVEITRCTAEALLGDDVTAEEVLELLDANGFLLFPELGLDDARQVAFSRKLGPVVVKGADSPGRGGEFREIFKVSLDPSLNSGPYMRSTVFWHIDGATDEIPPKASLLSARVVPDDGGDTQFVSTYAAYDRLSDEEKAEFESVQVVHSVETAHRLHDPDPTPEILARLRSVPDRVQPLVWHHRSGRRSLVLGATASHVVGMPEQEGRAFLDSLLERVTTPDAVYTHRWSLGDLVIWDNRGVMHRATHYEPDSGRRMHRVTLEGDEPIAAPAAVE